MIGNLIILSPIIALWLVFPAAMLCGIIKGFRDALKDDTPPPQAVTPASDNRRIIQPITPPQSVIDEILIREHAASIYLKESAWFEQQIAVTLDETEKIKLEKKAVTARKNALKEYDKINQLKNKYGILY